MTETSAQPLDIDHLRTWIGKTEEVSDIITPRLTESLRVTLFMDSSSPKTGDAVPLTVHWCLAPIMAAVSQIGPDGHPKRGGFLPPVPLPRRMWAGAQTQYVDALRVGDEVTRKSTIKDVVLKSGSTGSLCFVTVDHMFSTKRGEAIHEVHDIVYRDPPPPGGGNKTSDKAKAPPPQADHRRELVADPVMLFRYSAVTFNGHRIHYDRPYAMQVEGYPGLVFHGPYQAALLAEFAAHLRGGKTPKTYTHRGVAPLGDGPFTMNAKENGDAIELWTSGEAGTPCMTARASW
jgi:3-methylfumaryl-CoA hydratase